jgi:hypothetical protein
MGAVRFPRFASLLLPDLGFGSAYLTPCHDCAPGWVISGIRPALRFTPSPKIVDSHPYPRKSSPPLPAPLRVFGCGYISLTLSGRAPAHHLTGYWRRSTAGDFHPFGVMTLPGATRI